MFNNTLVETDNHSLHWQPQQPQQPASSDPFAIPVHDPFANNPFSQPTTVIGTPLTPSYDDGRPRPPMISTYLFKLKHKPSIIGSWTKRFWKINVRTEALEYFKTEGDAEAGKLPVKTIPINLIVAVRSIGDFFLQIIAITPTHTEIVFNLKAEKIDIKLKWVTELGEYFAALKAYEEEKYRATPKNKAIAGILEGYLHKLKHKPSSFGSWTRRYFKIDPLADTFSYYANENGTTPKHSYSLSDVTAVRPCDAWTMQVELGSPLEQIYSLRANSQEELLKWLKVFEKYLKDKRDYEDWTMMHKPAPTTAGLSSW